MPRFLGHVLVTWKDISGALEVRGDECLFEPRQGYTSGEEGVESTMTILMTVTREGEEE